MTGVEWEQPPLPGMPEVDGHQHVLVQHRDGRPPWCNACRRDAEGVYIGPPRRPQATVPRHDAEPLAEPPPMRVVAVEAEVGRTTDGEPVTGTAYLPADAVYLRDGDELVRLRVTDARVSWATVPSGELPQRRTRHRSRIGGDSYHGREIAADAIDFDALRKVWATLRGQQS